MELTQLRATALRGVRGAAAAAAPASMRGYATDMEPGKASPLRQGKESRLVRSFPGQVAGSIQARLRRESDQRKNYERWRHLTDPARNWTATFCERQRRVGAPVGR